MIDLVIIFYEFVITSMIGMYNYVVFYNWFAFDVQKISETLGQVSFSIILEHMPFDTQVEDLNTLKYLI
jgi:hypothetical protein